MTKITPYPDTPLAEYQAALAIRQRRFTKSAPWKLRKPKPPTTPKRAKVKAARKQRQRNG